MKFELMYLGAWQINAEPLGKYKTRLQAERAARIHAGDTLVWRGLEDGRQYAYLRDSHYWIRSI